jgi:hypothetical protein
MRAQLRRLVYAVTNDDGTGAMWKRLSPDGREVLRLAFIESRELGHPCLADEHVLLGVLRHGTSDGAALLRDRGLDLTGARAELRRIGPTLEPPIDPTDALRALGIDVEQVRRRLEATFGTGAVEAAEGRVRRRPRRRGGYPRPRPLCVYLLATRSFEFAVRFADDRRDAAIGPDHLLYGVLRDARDPLGTQLSRRSRRQLTRFGWIANRPNPLRLLLEARGITLTGLTTQLGG